MAIAVVGLLVILCTIEPICGFADMPACILLCANTEAH